MKIVLALFLVGAANSASIFNPRVQHAESSAPSVQYMSVDDLFGPTVVLTQDPGPVDKPVYISGPQAVIEEVAVVPSVKSAEPNTYLVNGPVAEYVIPFGINIPGIDLAADLINQSASVPSETHPAPEVVAYNFVSNKKREPTVIIPEPKVASKFDSNSVLSISNMLDTFYKQDDGMLEKELPTHVTYSVPAKPALAPVKKTEHVPAVDLWTPSPIVKKNPAPAKEFAPAVYRWTTSPPEKPVRQPKSGIDIVTPAPFVKPKSSDMAVEVVAEAEKPGVSKVEEDSEGYKIEEEELDANPKSEGEEKSVDAGTDVAETEEDEQKAEAKSVDEGTEGAEAEEGEQDIISKSGGEEKSASEGSEGGEAEEDEQDSSARNKGEENSADEAKAKNDITKGEKEEDESEEKRR